MQICHHENLKLYKNKYHFSGPMILLFWEVISAEELQPDLQKLSILTELPLPIIKKEL